MIGPPLAAGPTVGNAQDQPAGVIPKTDQRLVASPKKASPARPVGTEAAVFAGPATEHVCLNGNSGGRGPQHGAWCNRTAPDRAGVGLLATLNCRMLRHGPRR